MTGGSGTKGTPRPFTEEELAWIGANLSELRRSVYEQRTRYWTLWIGVVVGPSRKRPDVSGQRSADRKLAPG